jgi:hypothetical protein
MARSAFHKLRIATIPQLANATLRHVAIAARTKHRNTATRQDHNTATPDSNIATIRHDRIRDMTDWRTNALRQSGNANLPEMDNARLLYVHYVVC